MNSEAIIGIIDDKLHEIEIEDFSLGTLHDKVLLVKAFARNLAEANAKDVQKIRSIEKLNVQFMRGVILQAEFVQKVIEIVEEV